MHRRNFIRSSLGLAAAAATDMRTRGSEIGKRGKSLTLLHLTDTHAQLETHWEYLPQREKSSPSIVQMGGFARLKTAIDRQRNSAVGPAFLVDGGDLVQGSGPAAWSLGEVMIAPANALELDAFVPGNWEPVYGAKQFENLMSQLKTQVIAYNFHRTSNGKRLFAPATICVRDGVTVAFVGIADPTTTVRQPPAQVVGLDSTKVDGLREYVQKLRRDARPDLVVAVTHTGLALSRRLARDIPEFDVVLSGHTHERTTHVIREGKSLVVEAGSNGSFLGRMDVTLRPEGGIEKYSFKLVPISASDFVEDHDVAELVRRNLEPHRARMDERLSEASNPVLRYDVFETNADNLVSDVIRSAAGADVGFTNGFRFAPPIVAGAFTRGDLWNLLPLDTRVKHGWITGRELKSYMESELELVFSRDDWKLSGGWGPRASGMEVTFAAKAPAGSRLRSLTVAGMDVQDEQRYTVAGCEREGEPLDVVCRIRGVRDVAYHDATIHQAMEQHLRSHPMVNPTRERRSRAVDLPTTAFSQDQLLDAIRAVS